MKPAPHFLKDRESPIPPSRRWIAYAAIALLAVLVIASVVVR